MKKLLLISTLFIFACASDNSNDCEEMDTIIMDCECEFNNPNTFTVYVTTVDEENCEILEDCYCECYNDIDENGICDEDE